MSMFEVFIEFKGTQYKVLVESISYDAAVGYIAGAHATKEDGILRLTLRDVETACIRIHDVLDCMSNSSVPYMTNELPTSNSASNVHDGKDNLNDNVSHTWALTERECFLKLAVKQNLNQLDGVRPAEKYDIIAREMRKKGFYRSISQLKSQWYNEKQRFWQFKRPPTGRSTKECFYPFATIMDEYIGNSPLIQPRVLLSSTSACSTASHQKDRSAILSRSNDPRLSACREWQALVPDSEKHQDESNLSSKELPVTSSTGSSGTPVVSDQVQVHISRKRRSVATELVHTIRGFQDSTTSAILRVTTRATEVENSNKQMLVHILDRISSLEEGQLEIQRERISLERQRLDNEKRALEIREREMELMNKMLDFCNRRESTN